MLWSMLSPKSMRKDIYVMDGRTNLPMQMDNSDLDTIAWVLLPLALAILDSTDDRTYLIRLLAQHLRNLSHLSLSHQLQQHPPFLIHHQTISDNLQATHIVIPATTAAWIQRTYEHGNKGCMTGVGR